MSLNVLVILEDFRKDQYIVSPLVRRMFVEVGKPNANVKVCMDPLMGGISQAMHWTQIDEVIDMYPLVDIFLLLVDRDGNVNRREALDRIEGQACDKLVESKTFIGENAWQEVEVWALAGQDLPAEWKWQEIRAERDPKEVYFAPHAKQRNLTNEPGQGRTTMGREAAQNYDRVRSRCKEDIQSLEERLKRWLDKVPA